MERGARAYLQRVSRSWRRRTFPAASLPARRRAAAGHAAVPASWYRRRQDIRVAGDGQIAVHLDASGAVHVGVQPLPCGGGHACRPDHCLPSIRCPAAVAPSAPICSTLAFTRTSTPRTARVPAAPSARAFRGRRSGFAARLPAKDSGSISDRYAGSRRQRPARELGDRPGDLDTGRPASTSSNEGQVARAASPGRSLSRRSRTPAGCRGVAWWHPRASSGRARDSFRLVMPEIAVCRPSPGPNTS